MTSVHKIGKTNRTTAFLSSLLAFNLLSMSSAFAALQVIDTGLGVLDTSTNLEWTQNANLFGTLSATDPNLVSKIIASVGGIIHDTPNLNDPTGAYTLKATDFIGNGRGQLDWWGAQAWVGYLNSIDYAGHNDWRLPITAPVNGVTFNYNFSNNGSTDYGNGISSPQSELGHLFYSSLGNQANASGLQSGPFGNLQASEYWSGTEYALQPYSAWFLNYGSGLQSYSGSKIFLGVYAWAVRPAVVPIPASVWLFGSAGAGLIGVFGRRRKIAL